jgi:hypothetical protein
VFSRLGDPLNNRFLELVSFSFAKEVENYYAGTGDDPNHRFLDHDEVAFWSDLKAENELTSPSDHVTHLFFVFK